MGVVQLHPLCDMETKHIIGRFFMQRIFQAMCRIYHASCSVNLKVITSLNMNKKIIYTLLATLTLSMALFSCGDGDKVSDQVSITETDIEPTAIVERNTETDRLSNDLSSNKYITGSVSKSQDKKPNLTFIPSTDGF